MASFRSNMVAAFEVLADGLAPFVDVQMSGHYKDDWIMEVASKIKRSSTMPVSAADPQFQLDVMARFWGPVFAPVLEERHRETIKELKAARNEWAHFDGDVVTVDRAEQVCDWARELLVAIDSPEVPRLTRVEADLRFGAARAQALSSGTDKRSAEAELADQFRELRAERAQLREALAEAQSDLDDERGRQAATARQLALVQQRYAAVAEMTERLEALRDVADHAGLAPDADTEAELIRLEQEATALRGQLSELRAAGADDLASTPAGRRWLLLTTTLLLSLVLLALVIAGAGSAPPTG